MQKNRYCDLLEREDAKIFKCLSDDQGWFEELIFNDYGSRLDAIAITKQKHRKINIEIKQRCGKYSDFFEFIKYFDTIFLDYGKLNEFSEIMINSGATAGDGATFVSIFNNGDIVLIHDLNKKQPTMHLGQQRVWNEAKKRWETEYKLGLFWYCATIFQRDKDGHYKKWTDDGIKQCKEDVEDERFHKAEENGSFHSDVFVYQ